MWWIVAGLVAVIAGLPVLAWWRRRPMDKAARKDAPGRFAELGRGVTHYQWDGPLRGPVAVCVHGLTTPAYVWDALVGGLTRMGYRVLRYDLYGRGLSDRPAGAQDCDFFVTQLEDLLRDQEIDGGITLLGYSMGGAIATCYGARHPEMLDRLVLLAPAGLSYRPTRLAEVMRKLPAVGDWMMAVVGGWLMRRRLRADSATPSVVAEIYARQARETRYRGFPAAVLSSMRHCLNSDTAAQHKALAATDIPVLAIWGEADDVIGLEGLGRLAELNRKARQAEIPKAPHSMVYTHPPEVIGAMQEFLREV